MDLLIATKNKGKVIEICEALASLPVRILDLSCLTEGHTTDVDEKGATYAENALLKAEHFFSIGKMPTLADDSGIHVQALQGELGIHTRRWGAGPAATDAEWISYFLKRMQTESDRRATFICSLAYIDADGSVHRFEGRCDGMITESLEADYLPGLPISACFRPDGFDCVYSALSIEQKNRTSHRGRALGHFRTHLEHTLAPRP